jgi:hypothetical protein
MDNAKQKTTVSGWKVFVLTVVTWLVFTVLARGYASAMTTRSDLPYLLVEGQSIVWQWASLLMGIIMTIRVGRKGLELLWGGISFGVCIFPMGFVFGIAYFARCYFELEKKKKSDQSSAQIQVAAPDAVGSTKTASPEQGEIFNSSTAPKSGGYRMTGDDRQRLKGGDQHGKSTPTKVTKTRVTKEDRRRLKGLAPKDEEQAPQRESQTETQEENAGKEEELYAVAWQELEEKTFDKGLWAKLLVENDGDESKTRSEYLKERVKRLST